MNTAKLQYCDPVSLSVLKPRILVFNTVGHPSHEAGGQFNYSGIYEMIIANMVGYCSMELRGENDFMYRCALDNKHVKRFLEYGSFKVCGLNNGVLLSEEYIEPVKGITKETTMEKYMISIFLLPI
jgi:hypothetical protein